MTEFVRSNAGVLSNAEIGQQIGRTAKQVKDWCCKHGLSGRPRGDYGQGFSGRPFIRRGDENPRWNPDREAVRRTNRAEWREKRFAILKRDGYRCTECGLHMKKAKAETGQELNVHHIDFRASNDADENLVTLCRPHHTEAHAA